MIVSASSSNPVRPIGSAVNLTCTVHVELSPAADVPVILNIVWTGLDRFTTVNASQPVLGSFTTYTSVAVVSSFGRNESGIYTCTASLSSLPTNLYLNNGSTMSELIHITTGET